MTWGAALTTFGFALLAIAFVVAALVPWMKWLAMGAVIAGVIWVGSQWKATGSLKAAFLKMENQIKENS